MRRVALVKLKKDYKQAYEDAEKALVQTRWRIASEIRKIAKNPKIATNAGVRTKLYKKLNRYYSLFAEGYNDEMQTAVDKIAKQTHFEASDDIDKSGLLKYDPKRNAQYFAMITPENTKYLAATFTEQMSSDTIRGLRGAFVDTFRAGHLAGWTAKEMHKNLQSKWDAISGNLESHRFVDSAGRPWSNAQYMQMLTRTTLQRVHQEAYMDTMIEHGEDLLQIRAHGDACPICTAWNGVIVSITGTDKRFPSHKDAVEAGWRHPNCSCSTDGVIEELEEDEVNAQTSAKTPTPKERGDPEKMQKYNDEIAITKKRNAGMTKAEAHNDLIRDKLKHELNVVGLTDLHDTIDALPNDVLASMNTGKTPRFELIKRGGKAGAHNTNTSRGGVIYLDRKGGSDGDGQALKAQFINLQGKRGGK